MTLLQDRDSYQADNVLMSGPGGPLARARGGAVLVGSELRGARERLGWTLPEIAAGLRIREAYLDAIEDGRIDDLPGAAYAVGFVRGYATVLGLDPDQIAHRYRAETPATQKAELDFPTPVLRRGVPAGAVVLMGAILAIVGYIGWYHLSGQQAREADGIAPVPPRLAVLAEPAAAAGPSPQIASLLPAGGADQVALALSVASKAAAAARGIPLVVAPPEAEPAAAEPANAPPPPLPSSAEAAAPSSGQVTLRTTADSWVQVRDRSTGDVVLDRVMHAGESWPVPAGHALIMTTGNAGGTELVLDGAASNALGGAGTVLRNLSLAPDAVRQLLAASTPHGNPQ